MCVSVFMCVWVSVCDYVGGRMCLSVYVCECVYLWVTVWVCIVSQCVYVHVCIYIIQKYMKYQNRISGIPAITYAQASKGLPQKFKMASKSEVQLHEEPAGFECVVG